MEEDIIKHFEELKRNKEHIANIDTDFFFNFVENLINRNKELEEENKNIKNHIYYKEFVELNYIPKSKLQEIIYPTPENPISMEIQQSKMYKNLENLLQEGDNNETKM